MKYINWILHGISLIAILFLLYKQHSCNSNCHAGKDMNTENVAAGNNDFQAAFFLFRQSVRPVKIF